MIKLSILPFRVKPTCVVLRLLQRPCRLWPSWTPDRKIL